MRWKCLGHFHNPFTLCSCFIPGADIVENLRAHDPLHPVSDRVPFPHFPPPLFSSSSCPFSIMLLSQILARAALPYSQSGPLYLLSGFRRCWGRVRDFCSTGRRIKGLLRSDLKANQTVHAVKASAELSEPVSTNRSFSIFCLWGRITAKYSAFSRCASLVAL